MSITRAEKSVIGKKTLIGKIMDVSFLPRMQALGIIDLFWHYESCCKQIVLEKQTILILEKVGRQMPEEMNQTDQIYGSVEKRHEIQKQNF